MNTYFITSRDFGSWIYSTDIRKAKRIFRKTYPFQKIFRIKTKKGIIL